MNEWTYTADALPANSRPLLLTVYIEWSGAEPSPDVGEGWYDPELGKWYDRCDQEVTDMVVAWSEMPDPAPMRKTNENLA